MPTDREISEVLSHIARKRWEGVSDEERSEAMSSAAKSRWDNMSEEQRKAVGERLAAARAKKRGKLKKAAPKRSGKKASAK